jgi:4-hydroxy-tetrahydrodipicolinate reductase
MQTKRYRVAQWATGCTGMNSLRAIIDHPQMELAAVKVYSEDKAGRDAGELCGRASTGVIAARDIEAVLAAKPDCVAYMPDVEDVDDMCRLLAAGVNLVTPCLGFNHRDSIGAETRRRLEDACRQGRSSLYATGSSPGWLTELMPIALAALQRRIDCLTITDYSDMASSRYSAMMLFERIHFGADPKTIDPAEPVGTGVSTPPSLRMLMEALGLQADEIVCRREFALANTAVELAAGRVEVGTIGAVRMEVLALRAGQPLIRRRTVWYVTKDIDADWDLREGVHFQVEGDVPLDVAVKFAFSPDTAAEYYGAITANPVVNAIPIVCEAAPGIRHTSELPPIIPQFS